LSSPESLQYQLDSRFAQLNAAVELELWQEAFRSVEDIRGLMTLSKKPPKAKTMIAYFERLAQIFWVSENYLFHAYALHRYFQLSKSYNTELTEEQTKMYIK
jgi:translation initiation factor 3 subunit A